MVIRMAYHMLWLVFNRFSLSFSIVDKFNQSMLLRRIQFLRQVIRNFKTCKVSFRELTPIEIEKQIV